MGRGLIAGNWKMFGLQAQRAECAALTQALADRPAEGPDVLVCPPFTLLADAGRDLAGSGVALGGQDCHPLASGAHTGDISAEMLKDVGCTYVIVAHSERRALGETDATAHQKALAAARAGLTPIICVGETLDERDAGRAEPVVRAQVEASTPTPTELGPVRPVIAYEPVWAIGSGRTPTPADITAMHTAIRAALAGVLGDAGAAADASILYGGSVKPGNAGEILSADGVDGALVGGASLKASDFCAIIEAAPRR